MTSASGESRLKEWFREWRLPLRRFLVRRKLAPSADLDDIAQEVFLRLLRYDRAEVVERPQAYLFKIAVNVSNEWAMRSRRQMPHDSAWLADLIEKSSPETETERAVSDDQLHKFVETLPMRAQNALRLHFDEGMTRAEIAEALGVTRKIVKRDIERAYASLRFLLHPAKADGHHGRDRDEDSHE